MAYNTIREREEAFEARLENAGYCFGGLFDCDCACAAPANYQPVADASAAASKEMAELGREQLAEAKRQYDLNMGVAKPIVDKQSALMDQQIQQGNDYYNYMVSQQRPVEQVLNAEAMAAGSEAKQEEMAGKAMADARQGTTQQQNQLIRQGMRYGWSPAKIAAATGAQALQSGLSVASAANVAREKEKATGYAKKMDVAGLYRGLPGASQGAYSLANQSGNSAVQNQQTPSNAYMNAVSQGIGAIGSGNQMKLQGLTGVMNAQTSYANAQNQAMNSGGGGAMGGIGSMLGGMASLYTAFSDRRMKERVECVGRDEQTGLALYEFNYIGAPEQRFRGVMADEVESIYPAAVSYDDLGFASVHYGMLGLEMTRV